MATIRISVAIASLAALAAPAAAQAPSLPGKNVQMIIGSGSGDRTTVREFAVRRAKGARFG
jgi:hypothetical protein